MSDSAEDGPGVSRRSSADRCPRCRLPRPLCLCAEVPRVQNRTRVLVLRHHHEEPRPSNTARIAALALENIDLVEWVPRSPPDLEPLLANRRPAWVLYPGEGNVDPCRDRPQTLVVLDATWKQARKMLHHHPQVLQLPRWGLPATGVARARLRQSGDPRARSTLEAIADALTLLEGQEIGDPLHRLHDVLVQRVLRARGRLPSESA